MGWAVVILDAVEEGEVLLQLAFEGHQLISPFHSLAALVYFYG